MEMPKHKDFILVAPFGSRAVGCATDESDYDYLVLVKVRPGTQCSMTKGYKPDSGDPLYGMYFSSWRKGKVNLVFTDYKEFFDATMEALEFCIKYKVFDKSDRCRVHEAFRARLEIPIDHTF